LDGADLFAHVADTPPGEALFIPGAGVEKTAFARFANGAFGGLFHRLEEPDVGLLCGWQNLL